MIRCHASKPFHVKCIILVLELPQLSVQFRKSMRRSHTRCMSALPINLFWKQNKYTLTNQKTIFGYRYCLCIGCPCNRSACKALGCAKVRSSKGGIKLQAQLDLSISIPACMLVTPASVHDVKILVIRESVSNRLCVVKVLYSNNSEKRFESIKSRPSAGSFLHYSNNISVQK